MAKAKKGKRVLFSLTGTIVLCALAVAFIMGCLAKTRSLKADAAELDEQIAILEEQLADEKLRALESQVQKRYYESDAYKENLARNKFNLVYAGERLYIIE